MLLSHKRDKKGFFLPKFPRLELSRLLILSDELDDHFVLSNTAMSRLGQRSLDLGHHHGLAERFPVPLQHTLFNHARDTPPLTPTPPSTTQQFTTIPPFLYLPTRLHNSLSYLFRRQQRNLHVEGVGSFWVDGRLVKSVGAPVGAWKV